MLKQRLKCIEHKIGKNYLTKLWVIYIGGCNTKEEKEKFIEKQKADIEKGIIKNSDGSYFSDADKNIFIISSVPRPNGQK